MAFVSVNIQINQSGQIVERSISFPAAYMADPDKLRTVIEETIPWTVKDLIGHLPLPAKMLGYQIPT